VIDLEKARAAVSAFQDLLDKTPPEAATVRIAPDAWTLTEIVGHLIDSAGNNHQRFARLRLGNLEGFPGYEAEAWVRAQDYAACDFQTLSGLWTHYNALLLHLAATTPPAARQNAWVRPEGSQSLEFLVADYYAHMGKHIEHYARRLAEVEAVRARS
jgi:hypothetical protein